MEDRFINLEMKIAFLEKHLGELDEFVRELSGELTTLRKQLEFLKYRLGAGEPGEPEELDEELPE